MTKPSLLKWIPDDDVAKISDPGTTKKNTGWIYKEKIAFQFLNWIPNLISKWLLGLQGNYCDIVVGSAAQVTANEATHVITDLDDTLVVAGSRVLFLGDQTHALTGHLVLANADVTYISENPTAIIALGIYTLTFSGARNLIRLRVAGAGAGDIIVSGAGSIFEGIDVAISSVVVSNGAIARTSGTSSGSKLVEFIGKLTGNADSATKHGILNVIVIDIGDWDMDADGTNNFAHGIADYKKIREVSVLIRDDADANYRPLNFRGNTDGNYFISGANIFLTRIAAGIFDSTSFDQTTYNRGWVTIYYVD